MKHKTAIWIVSISSVLMASSLFLLAAKEFAGKSGVDPVNFVWRWFGLVFIVAIAAIIGVLIILVRRVTTRNGAFLWFALVLFSNVAYLSLLLAQTLGASASVAAFWQGTLPLGWTPIAVLLLFFVISIVDDVDVPRDVRLWLTAVAALPFLLFVAGFSDIVESHVPINSTLEWWGYQGVTGKYESIVLMWGAIMSITSLVMLGRAFRVATDQNRRRQLKLFLIALSQYIGLAVVFDLFLFSLFPHAFPPLSPFYNTSMSIIIAYGILKYGLFQISAARLSGSILRNLSEAVVGVNREFRVEFSNKGAEEIFGYQENSLRGMQVSKLFNHDSFEIVQKRVDVGIQSVVFDNFSVLNASGATIPVSMTINQIQDDRGKPAGYIFVVQNVTELKKKTAELAREKESIEHRVIERTRQLHEERAKLKSSIESLALGFILVDSRGRVSIRNKVIDKLFNGVVFETVTELSNKFRGFELAKYCVAAQRPGAAPIHKEVNYDNKVLRVFIAGVTPEDEGDSSSKIGAVVLIEDITEMKVLERSRDEFFSIASHELRTPLTAIRGNASMILDYYKDTVSGKEVKEVISDIHESSIRLIDIVNDFLDMSRLEQGKVLFEYMDCELDRIIEGVIYEMKANIKEKKLNIKYEGMTLGALPRVWADPVRVKQIAYNLFSNAVKFTDEGSITIAAIVEGDKVKVYITDSGRGIAVESRKLLFHKFQQAGESILTRDTTRGTGLGLYISRLMAEEMGGHVELENSEEGKGSTFSFSLLIATPERMKQQNNPKLHVDPTTGLTTT